MDSLPLFLRIPYGVFVNRFYDKIVQLLRLSCYIDIFA